MRLYLYLARRFAVSLLALLAIFTLLAALLEMIEVLRRFDSATIGLVQVAHLTALKIPKSLYQILPLVVILATLTMFLNLAKTSELVVTRAAGRSALRSLLAPVMVALLVGVLSVAVFNPIVAATSKQYQTLSNRYLKGNASVLSVSPEGLWLRQGSQSGQTVIRAKRANRDGTRLSQVTFMGFSPDGLPQFRIEAESARLVPGAWIATNAKEWRFGDSANPELNARRSAELRLASDLTVKRIREGFAAPASIPIWELPAFIDRLKRAGFSARRHQVWLQTELAQPVLLVTMVIIGAGFTMRHTRFGRTGLMILLALLLGFGIYFIRNFAQILGENGQIPVLLAAWAPPAAGLLLALGLLLHVEDG
jgi:lipopolysaccharide export system permease protein